VGGAELRLDRRESFEYDLLPEDRGACDVGRRAYAWGVGADPGTGAGNDRAGDVRGSVLRGQRAAVTRKLGKGPRPTWRRHVTGDLEAAL